MLLREQKGSRLTLSEVDANFRELRDGSALRVPSTQTGGVKVGTHIDDVYPWHDLLSTLHVDPSSPLAPQFIPYAGNIKGRAFDEGDEAFIEFHIPHDYLMGSEMHIHAHWSQNSAVTIGGSVTWGFEIIYAKGHDQDVFDTPILVAVTQMCTGMQRMHHIAETVLTSESGSGTTLPVGDIEPDGIVMVRVYLDSNDLVTSDASVPLPFLHFVDIHYRSTGVGTRNKAPNFWG